MSIQARLFGMQDVAYAEFQRKLIPNINPQTIIGVRTPQLRSFAKELAKTPDGIAFLSELPHRFFEENQLHAFLITQTKDITLCLQQTHTFLPYVDNWATCDQLSPKVFAKHKQEVLRYIRQWIVSEEEYTVRFAMGMLMRHFLDSDFSAEYPALVAAIQSDKYYIKMMQAWYFATALAKQYEAVIPYLQQGRLDRWTHNKTIQKSIESYRIAPETKTFLKTLTR